MRGAMPRRSFVLIFVYNRGISNRCSNRVRIDTVLDDNGLCGAGGSGVWTACCKSPVIDGRHCDVLLEFGK
jgi:hypothetical protein